MNILLLGGGGREHAMARSLAKSKRLNQLYIAPGNAGTSQHGTNISLDILDFDIIKSSSNFFISLRVCYMCSLIWSCIKYKFGCSV